VFEDDKECVHVVIKNGKLCEVAFDKAGIATLLGRDANNI